MADKKKKQAGRRAYLNDFHRDLTGAYIYDGSHFHFAGDGWKQVLLRLWALGLVLVVLVLAGGFSGEAMSHCVFQILPYLVEVGAVGSVVWALVRLTSGGETLPGLRLQGHRSGAAGTGRAGDVRRPGPECWERCCA